mmetsp:Transcript_19322/g.24586  ORF Transcript_19322/g.24586 Transcript_19322/m.24586 type:complete len:556 (+) Transcript_19322:13-1680(+)
MKMESLNSKADSSENTTGVQRKRRRSSQRNEKEQGIKGEKKAKSQSDETKTHIKKKENISKVRVKVVLKNSHSDNDYAIWKKNVSCIYDFLFHHSLSWASLTCAFGGSSDEIKNYARSHSVYFSSRTDATFNPASYRWTGKPSEILIAEVEVPQQNTAARKHLGRFTDTQRSGRIQVKKKIIHPGEVNRIRTFSQHPHLIVSKTDSASVFFWNTLKQPNKIHSKEMQQDWVQEYLKPLKQDDDNEVDQESGDIANVPDLTLDGHTDKAEYAVDCCSDSMKVVSGGSDAKVLCWSVEDYQTSLETKGKRLQARTRFVGHTDNVEDCVFKPGNSDVCCSVGDDKLILIWDARVGENYVSKVSNAHKDDINCCSINKINPNYVLTGSSDTTIKLLDLRKLGSGHINIMEDASAIVHVFEHHTTSVLNVKWSPNDSRYFSSTSEEIPLCIWDTKIKNDTDIIGEPELLFRHMGHKAPVVDFAWNSNIEEPWLFTTVSDSSDQGGGTMQVWRISDFVTQVENEEFTNRVYELACLSEFGKSNKNGTKSGKSVDSDEVSQL